MDERDTAWFIYDDGYGRVLHSFTFQLNLSRI